MIAGKDHILRNLKDFHVRYHQRGETRSAANLSFAINIGINNMLKHLNKDSSVLVHLAYSGGLASTVVLKLLVSLNAKVFCHTAGLGFKDPVVQKATKNIALFGNDIWGHRTYLVTEEDMRNAKLELESMFKRKVDAPSPYYVMLKKISENANIKHLVFGDFSNHLFAGCNFHLQLSEGSYRNIIQNSIPTMLDYLETISNHFNKVLWFPYLSCSILNYIKNNLEFSDMIGNGYGDKPLKEVASHFLLPCNLSDYNNSLTSILQKW